MRWEFPLEAQHTKRQPLKAALIVKNFYNTLQEEESLKGIPL